MLPLVIAICERKEGLDGDGKKRKRDGEERRETGEEENPFKECAFVYDTLWFKKAQDLQPWHRLFFSLSIHRK